MNSKHHSASAFGTEDLLRLMRIWGWTSMSIKNPQHRASGVTVLEREDRLSPAGETASSDADPQQALIDTSGQLGTEEGWTAYWAYPNPDGSIRWLVPASDRKARFLAFYNQATFRAKLLASVWRTAAWLNAKRFYALLGIRPLAVRFPDAFLNSQRGQLHRRGPAFSGNGRSRPESPGLGTRFKDRPCPPCSRVRVIGKHPLFAIGKTGGLSPPATPVDTAHSRRCKPLCQNRPWRTLFQAFAQRSQ